MVRRRWLVFMFIIMKGCVPSIIHAMWAGETPQKNSREFSLAGGGVWRGFEPKKTVEATDFTDSTDGERVAVEGVFTRRVTAEEVRQRDETRSHPCHPCHPWFLNCRSSVESPGKARHGSRHVEKTLMTMKTIEQKNAENSKSEELGTRSEFTRLGGDAPSRAVVSAFFAFFYGYSTV